MCLEKDQLATLYASADMAYRRTVDDLDRANTTGPGTARRAIQTAHRAWSRRNAAEKALADHLLTHGCGVLLKHPPVAES
jgi:hypothetical protein